MFILKVLCAHIFIKLLVWTLSEERNEISCHCFVILIQTCQGQDRFAFLMLRLLLLPDGTEEKTKCPVPKKAVWYTCWMCGCQQECLQNRLREMWVIQTSLKNVYDTVVICLFKTFIVDSFLLCFKIKLLWSCCCLLAVPKDSCKES